MICPSLIQAAPATVPASSLLGLSKPRRPPAQLGELNAVANAFKAVTVPTLPGTRLHRAAWAGPGAKQFTFEGQKLELTPWQQKCPARARRRAVNDNCDPPSHLQPQQLESSLSEP